MDLHPDWGRADAGLLDDFPLAEPSADVPDHLTRESLAAWYFARMLGTRVRFDHGSKQWMLWSQHHWTPDHKGVVKELWLRVLAERYRRALLDPPADEKARTAALRGIQDGGASDRTISGGLAIASTMDPIATAGDAWDRDPYLLGCENGVVDLRTGQLRAGRPEDMISLSTGIVYRTEATCPRFDQFLAEIFARDDELVEWIRRLVGSSLIGKPLEEVLPIHHGAGNNGKSVFMKVLKRAVGEYGVVVGVETLLDARRRAGAATPDLMPLRGARIAFMAEPDQGAKLRGGTLKRLVSIEALSGREVFGKQTAWEPTHTIHLVTNHLPVVDDASEGAWRRIAAVPYVVHFRKAGEKSADPPEETGLLDKLYAQAPGILAWAVRGAVEAAKGQSLWPLPAAVQSKTATYRADEDQLAGFVADRVVYAADGKVSLRDLHGAYQDWCEAESVPLGERMKSRAFGAAFEGRGRVRAIDDGHGRKLFEGARLKGPGDPPDAQSGSPDSRSRESVGVSPSTRAREESTPTAPVKPEDREADAANQPVAPSPNDGLCPQCHAGPFISREFYERHFVAEHEYGRGATDPDAPPAPRTEFDGGVS